MQKNRPKCHKVLLSDEQKRHIMSQLLIKTAFENKLPLRRKVVNQSTIGFPNNFAGGEWPEGRSTHLAILQGTKLFGGIAKDFPLALGNEKGCLFSSLLTTLHFL